METAILNPAVSLNSNLESIDIRECLRMIGIQEITANIYSLPSKKSKSTKETKE